MPAAVLRHSAPGKGGGAAVQPVRLPHLLPPFGPVDGEDAGTQQARQPLPEVRAFDVVVKVGLENVLQVGWVVKEDVNRHAGQGERRRAGTRGGRLLTRFKHPVRVTAAAERHRHLRACLCRRWAREHERERAAT